MRREVSGWMLAGLVCLAGCLSPAEKLQKAKQEVELDPATFLGVGTDFTRLHPCANDSFFVTKSDTTRDTVIMIQGGDISGTTPLAARLDTVVITRTITQRIQDTTKISIIDATKVRELRDSVNAYKLSLASAQGITQAAQVTANNWENKYHWFLWLTVLGALVLVLAYFLLSKYL